MSVVAVGGKLLIINGSLVAIGASASLIFTPSPLPNYTDGVFYSILCTALNGTGPFTLNAGPTGMVLVNVDSTHFLLQIPSPVGTGTTTVTVTSTT